MNRWKSRTICARFTVLLHHLFLLLLSLERKFGLSFLWLLAGVTVVVGGRGWRSLRLGSRRSFHNLPHDGWWFGAFVGLWFVFFFFLLRLLLLLLLSREIMGTGSNHSRSRSISHGHFHAFFQRTSPSCRPVGTTPVVACRRWNGIRSEKRFQGFIGHSFRVRHGGCLFLREPDLAGRVVGTGQHA